MYNKLLDPDSSIQSVQEKYVHSLTIRVLSRCRLPPTASTAFKAGFIFLKPFFIYLHTIALINGVISVDVLKSPAHVAQPVPLPCQKLNDDPGFARSEEEEEEKEQEKGLL